MNHHLARHIGKRLRSRRRLLDLSQAQVAANCGCSPQTVHKYETGSVQIPAAALYALACTLEVPTGYFFEDYDLVLTRTDGASPGKASARFN